jgi:hypothetical protein
MTCSRCGAQFEGLACPGCVWKKSAAAVLELQRQLLPEVLSNLRPLLLAKRRRCQPYHIQLFGEPTRGYCGAELQHVVQKSQWTYKQLNPRAVCGSCLKSLAALVTLAQREQP